MATKMRFQGLMRFLAGLQTDTIAEDTSAAGVTVDGVLLKDGGVVLADGAAIDVDTINEATAAAGVTADGVLLKDGSIVCADGSSIEVDTVNEATAANGVTVDGLKIKDGAIESNDIVIATVAVTGGSGGSADGTLTLSLTTIGGTDLTAARRVLLVTRAAQYQPSDAVVSTVTFSTATTGSIVASGSGWALVQTDAAGDFACTISDSADETVYTAAIAPVGAGAASVHAIESNDAAGTWSA